MKWFKHDSNAMLDAKLKRVRLKYGMEGYGLYWYCLELIASSVELHNLTFELEHDAELISLDTGIHQERVQEMMLDMVKWELFESSNGVIVCLKMASRTDEYTQKLIRAKGINPTKSTHTPDSLPTQSDLIEENREEENNKPSETYSSDFIEFWNVYPRKDDKKKSAKAWGKLSKAKKEKATEDIKTRFKGTEKRFIPLATTYINGERWDDEAGSSETVNWEALASKEAKPGESMEQFKARASHA